MEEVRAVLLDDAGSPLSICVPPRPSSLTGPTAPVASILMRPALGEMEIALMPSQGADYRRYALRSEEHTSELQSLMRISYTVCCLTKQPTPTQPTKHTTTQI